jgi:predicted DNA-binding protein
MQQKTEIIRTSYRIPRTLKKNVERYSVESDKTETEIVKEALEEYLQRHFRASVRSSVQ